ncbi:murein biosynthesis integral membrane protein MurJ [Candidatus Poribacteria bacterium]|nr:murein biosynthesis integral membrane protein MurJ [Candidatus Poribacteria bacterium]
MTRSLVRNAGVLAFFTGISRILGLVRDQVFLALFGAGNSVLNDAYLAAFRIPNLFRDLFAEGAMSAAFVTTFSATRENDGDEKAWALGNRVIAGVAVFVGGLVVLGMIGASVLVGLIAPGFGDIPGKAELTTQLTRILWPFLLLVALAAVWMGMLNAHDRFAVPASASTMFNVGSLAIGVPVAYLMDPSWGPKAMVGMTLGTLAGGALQWLVQVPALRREGFRTRPKLDLRDEGFRKVVALMAPAVVGTAAVQINVTVNTVFATMIAGNGPVSWLSAAFRLMQFPIGVFGVAVGTAMLPALSRSAIRSDMVEYRATLARSLRLVAMLCLPSACGLAILAEPLIGALYQHGRFLQSDTIQTAWALRYYAIGLTGYAAIKVLAPASYALGDARTPALVSVASIAVNLFTNWLFTMRLGWGHRGLALAVSVVALVNSTALLVAISQRIGAPSRRSIIELSKVGLATLAMAAVCWLASVWLGATLGASFAARSTTVMACVALSIVVYWAAAQLLRIQETADVVAMLRRRLRRHA